METYVNKGCSSFRGLIGAYKAFVFSTRAPYH